ncbi:MAG: HAMP domain-containing sensor histidine kinase [Desulfobulbaceae bacterium]
MSSGHPSENRRSLAARLTLWYGLLFTLSSAAVFLGLHLSLSHILKNRVDDALAHEFSELAKEYETGGVEGLTQAMVIESRADGMDTLFLRLLTRKGEVLAATTSEAFGAVPVNRAALDILGEGNDRRLENLVLEKEGHPLRVLYGVLDRDLVLQVVFSMKKEHHFLQVFWRTGSIALVLLAAIASLGGWLMSRRALRGVEGIIAAAEEISAGELDRRVKVPQSGDEIERLARTFNAMLDRIAALLTGMRELTDSIAHDLRSPIARMRASAETALFEPHSGEKTEQFAAGIIEECDRLLIMLNTMLDISEAEAGAAALDEERIDIVELVLDGCELFEPLAEEKKIDLQTDLPSGLYIRGDRGRLQRVIANLLDNALKFTGEGGRVTVRMSRDGNMVRIAFSDSGPGIPAAQQPLVFSRFYRGDKSRGSSGVGLGLSLARAFCRAHGGDIALASIPGEGSTFTVILPNGT